ncbi:hypothetical protein ACFLXJ_06210 [Chloroflexota bacterium]
MIKTIIRLKNDLVMVFDDEGEQVPSYQGQYKDVKGNILRDAPAGTVFTHWSDCAAEPEPVYKEAW